MGDTESLKFPLLSDFNKEVISRYSVVNPDMIGLKDGTVTAQKLKFQLPSL